MKAAVYLRISTDREGRELDAERQRVDCLQLAGTLGVDVVEVYLDNDTESSGRARRRRPAYRRMLADAGARRFGTVIAHTSSRLAHLPEEYEDLIELAQRHGTRFAYVMSASSPTIGSSDEPPTGSSLLPIVGAFDLFRRLAGELSPELKGLVADAAPVIEPLAEGVAGFVRNAMPGLRGMVRESAPFVGELSRSLPPLGHALGTFLGRAAPGVPGASAFATDVVNVAAGQAALWGEVIQRLSRAYLTVRTTVTDVTGDVDEALAALPERTRTLVLSLFDQVTTAVGVGIGAALRSCVDLPAQARAVVDSVRRRLTSTVDAADSAVSAMVDAAAEALVNLPARVARTTSEVGDALRGAGTRVWDEARNVVGGVVSGTGPATAGLSAAVVERATRNILLGVRCGLDPARTAAEVTPWIGPDAVVAEAIAAPLGGTAPAGIAVDGLNVNLYGTWDLTDSATFDRVAAGIHEALNRYRQEYA